MRILHLFVIAFLVAAASYVYKIKFESTQRVERIAKLRSEIRRENESIAQLRAEWAKLESPARIADLAKRHLALKAAAPAQFQPFEKLPDRPPPPLFADSPDPLGSLIELEESTGSIPSTAGR